MASLLGTGYSHPPLKFGVLLGIFQQHMRGSKSGYVQDSRQATIRKALMRFLHFRQKRKMALLLYLMTLLMLIAAVSISTNIYMFGLTFICFLGFTGLARAACLEQRACTLLLGQKKDKLSDVMLLLNLPIYFWFHFKSDFHLRAQITEALAQSDLFHT